jgi:hypothetical protein
VGKVFGVDHDAHELDADLEMYISKDPHESLTVCLGRSVGINIRCDRRVPAARAESFLDVVRMCRKNGSTTSLEACCRHYHITKVRQGAEFLTDANETNRRSAVHPNHRLVTVFNVSGVYTELQAVAEYPISDVWTLENWQVFNNHPKFPLTREAYSDWLTGRLSSNGKYEQSLGAILKGLAIFGENSPYRPCWVTKWSSFEKYKDDAGK